MSRSLPIAANRSSGAVTVESALKDAVCSLIAHSSSAHLDAGVLLSHVLRIDRAALIARGSNPLADEDLEVYRELLERRKAGMPVAYLTGRREFWSLPLKVTPAVLVPRPETEMLVEIALQHLPLSEERAVLDLGTGSGAVALALASERPRARVVAVDVSPGAFDLARDNARRLALPNVTFRLGSWFEPVPGEVFDVVVANPPYVADGDPALAALAAEPQLALVAGTAGLDALEAIIAQAPQHLSSGGWLVLEHGSTQQQAVAALLERHGFVNIACHFDYSGLPRVTRGTVSQPVKEHT
jgi:release factor glutamine methyltransferase